MELASDRGVELASDREVEVASELRWHHKLVVSDMGVKMVSDIWEWRYCYNDNIVQRSKQG